MNAVTSLDEYRMQNGIKHLLGQAWPTSRREFLEARRDHADQGLRETICLHCEQRSPMLEGPSGRAWWEHHKTVCRPLP